MTSGQNDVNPRRAPPGCLVALYMEEVVYYYEIFAGGTIRKLEVGCNSSEPWEAIVAVS